MRYGQASADVKHKRPQEALNTPRFGHSKAPSAVSVGAGQRRYLVATLQRHLAEAPLRVPALGQLALGQEALLGGAVPTLVGPFVEGAAVPEGFPEALHSSLVPGLAGAGEVSEGDAGLGQGLAEKARDALAELRG